MAKFLNTSAITYYVEELIKGARERLIIISPYLKFNDRVRELLEDKDRLKIDVRIVYGKNELHPDETNWLKSLGFVRCSFCKNLHAKCYLSETGAIVTSMNMYEFSQVNNNEMGVLITRKNDPELYSDAYKEAQRLIRISDEVKLSVEKVTTGSEEPCSDEPERESAPGVARLSTTKLSKHVGMKTKDLFTKLLRLGWIEKADSGWALTAAGEEKGGVVKNSKRYGEYITWPSDLNLGE
ncbi:phospholipase D family protein [Aeoliella mucimassa]|uniref:Phospholipase D-like domain-containing protein n=1 Tax=Aeoliella mucimassa TaxID=2527972 RepID=A0A518AMA9_9BACT|nr:phospholipase D family protein [Aeoliella mucimassa]QDU55862.1 hypothetical protein Pan181_20590 [Aeoliella mucimassa]